MARPAPAIDRTMAMMWFPWPAARAKGSPSRSSLRQLNINKATTHGMVAALVEAGWVGRPTGTSGTG